MRPSGVIAVLVPSVAISCKPSLVRPEITETHHLVNCLYTGDGSHCTARWDMTVRRDARGLTPLSQGDRTIICKLLYHFVLGDYSRGATSINLTYPK